MNSSHTVTIPCNVSFLREKFKHVVFLDFGTFGTKISFSKYAFRLGEGWEWSGLPGVKGHGPFPTTKAILHLIWGTKMHVRRTYCFPLLLVSPYLIQVLTCFNGQTKPDRGTWSSFNRVYGIFFVKESLFQSPKNLQWPQCKSRTLLTKWVLRLFKY